MLDERISRVQSSHLGTDPQKQRKLNPSKISSYTVYSIHACICTVHSHRIFKLCIVFISDIFDICLCPCSFDINHLVVSVEAENRCQLIESSAIELRVLQVSCASSLWTINKMDKQQSKDSLSLSLSLSFSYPRPPPTRIH